MEILGRSSKRRLPVMVFAAIGVAVGFVGRETFSAGPDMQNGAINILLLQGCDDISAMG